MRYPPQTNPHHTICGVYLGAKSCTAKQGFPHQNAISCSIRLMQAPTALFRPPWPAPERRSARYLPKPGGSCAGAVATGPTANNLLRGWRSKPI
jgi:hypothetical protein